MSDATRVAARGTGLVLLGSVIGSAAEYLYRLALARGLGPDGFGTFSQAHSILFVTAVLCTLGLGLGVKRFVAKFREEGRSAEARRVIADGTRLVTAAALAGAAVLFFLAGPLAAAFQNPALELPLRVLAAALPVIVGLEYVTRLGEAFRSFGQAVLAKHILDPVLRLAGGVAVLALGAGLPWVMGAYGAASACALAVAIALVARLGPLHALDRAKAASQTGPLLRFSLPLVFGGVLFDFAERIDILMIGLYREEAQVGVYAVGSALARSLLVLVSSTMPAVGTLAAEAVGRGSPEDVARLHRMVARWMLFFTAPIAVGLLLFSEEAVTLLFGGEYAGAAPTLRVLVLAYMTGMLVGPVGLLLSTLGKTHWMLGNMAIRTAVNVLLNLWLIPRFGILGAAWGTMISLALSSLLSLAWLAKLAPVRGSYSGWGRPALVLGAAAALGWGVARLLALATGFSQAAAVAGGVALLIAFALGVRRVPGCLEDADLALLRAARSRARA